MMGPGHMAGAAVVTMGAGLALIHTGRPVSSGEVLVATALAVPFSAGSLSPDADLPGRWLGWLGHRRGAHWLGWPLLVIVALASNGAPFMAYGPALGWLSHIWPCDWVFGKGGQHVPMGIPRWPWRGSPRHGLGLRTTAANGTVSRALVGNRSHSALELVATGGLVLVALVEMRALAGLA